jgi:hypothetical protein
MDVSAWLRALGLEHYAPAFRDNDIDAEILPELTADDLIGRGVTSIGHRTKQLHMTGKVSLRAIGRRSDANNAPKAARAGAPRLRTRSENGNDLCGTSVTWRIPDV